MNERFEAARRPHRGRGLGDEAAKAAFDIGVSRLSVALVVDAVTAVKISVARIIEGDQTKALSAAGPSKVDGWTELRVENACD